jgi:RNA polymerase sigma-70 factor (ECF subfamily)
MPERDRPDLIETFIVLRAQTGDVEAFDALYRIYAPILLRHLRHILGDADRAEDALQDVFVLVYRKLRWLRDPASVRPWLYRMATRHALRMSRTRSRRLESQLADEEWAQIARHATEGSLERSLTSEQARDAIAKLPPISRAVLSLHYLEALPLADVARVLGVPAGTAKSRLAAGLDRLRRVFRAGRE